ncbi:MAG: DnaJ domain-containing protein [Aestuariivirgaceae bacterium]
MPQLLLVLAAAALFFWIIGKYGRGNPASTAVLIRQAGGVGLIALSGVLALRGGAALAAPMFVLGLGMLNKNFPFGSGNFNWGRKSEGQKSSVRTSMLSMELDHDTGTMDGEVLAGTFKGRRLKTMSLEELVRFLPECHAARDQSANLLEAYLDRNHDGWRSTSGAGKRAGPVPPSGAMTREEAHAVLGLKSNASEDDIRSAHRRLMKQYHPDHGGSDYLASKINQAKETLVG